MWECIYIGLGQSFYTVIPPLKNWQMNGFWWVCQPYGKMDWEKGRLRSFWKNQLQLELKCLLEQTLGVWDNFWFNEMIVDHVTILLFFNGTITLQFQWKQNAFRQIDSFFSSFLNNDSRCGVQQLELPRGRREEGKENIRKIMIKILVRRRRVKIATSPPRSRLVDSED